VELEDPRRGLGREFWFFVGTKNRVNVYVIELILYSTFPFGVSITIESPTRFLSNAFPIGDSTDIFASAGFASNFCGY
jgi:hypothetical protein